MRFSLVCRAYRMSTKNKSALVWYRYDDLRTLDHRPLVKAHDSANSVAHVLCIDPADFKASSVSGLPRYASHRFKFFAESVSDLEQTFLKHNSRLLVRVGPVATVVADTAVEISAGTVYAHRGYCPEEQDHEKAVKSKLSSLDKKLDLSWGNVMYTPPELPFSVSKLPGTFSAYRKKVEDNQLSPSANLPKDGWKPLPDGFKDLPSDDYSAQRFGIEEAELDSRSVLPFTGGETAGLERVQGWIWDQDCLKTYKETRNGWGTGDFSSKFAPWLATGSLSPKTIVEEVTRYETERVANESTYWLFFELLWRDFFRIMALKYGSALFLLGGPQRDSSKQKWSQDAHMFNAWAAGQTGHPLVDANMRELRATGYLSNRGRQIVASFFTKDLGLDWRLGAEHFEAHLLDHDPASNYGNWTYVAGVGCDPREGRYFNVVKQGKTYDPNGKFTRLWCPELSKLRIESLLAASRSREELDHVGADEYPTPVVPLRHSQVHPKKGSHNPRQQRQKKKHGGKGHGKGNGNCKRKSRVQSAYLQ